MPSRNTEAYFSQLPKANIQRSIFNMPFNHKTSFNVGELIPFYCLEVVPGDTHQIRTSVVARLQTLLTPVMDDMYLETFYFFVPNRLVWDHWKNFCGENDNGPWIQDQVKYTVPYLEYPTEGAFNSGTIADYFGIPLEVSAESGDDNYNRTKPMVLPFRAYAMIVDQFFRDQNLQQPVVIHRDDVNRIGSNGSNYITDLELGGKPFVVNRYHDYFSSCLPAPQRSENITIFGNTLGSNGPLAPVIAGPNHSVSGAQTTYKSTGSTESKFIGVGNSTGTGTYNAIVTNANDQWSLNPVNLWANLNVPEATITQLRLAFQLQKYYEKSARGGSRYREYLAEFFGVQNGDARMQVPEYLGGHRVPLSIHQVANTSQTADADLGDVGAMSNTSDVHDDFQMSFSEHGFIIGLMCVRYNNTYSQGIEKFWSRRDILDFYNPVFAHISEQPVYAREIYAGTALDNPNRVWGYNEAWADYRYKPSRVSGEMRPEVQHSLASWHLADDYKEAPSLSSSWLQVSKGTVDRVLAVGSDVANQVFADIFVQDKAVRPMPVHSIPGLADHF